MRKLTSVGFGRVQPSKSTRKGEWVVVETVISYGEPTGDCREVFIGSHRQCIDYRDTHDTNSDLELLRVS